MNGLAFVEHAHDKPSQVPFIYLSAGVSDEVFLESLELAAEAGTPFSGVLCGRATWQDGIPVYAKGGSLALRSWLEDKGVQNIQALNVALKEEWIGLLLAHQVTRQADSRCRPS